MQERRKHPRAQIIRFPRHRIVRRPQIDLSLVREQLVTIQKAVAIIWAIFWGP